MPLILFRPYQAVQQQHVASDYAYSTFTSSATFVLPSTKDVEYLIVAGGGGNSLTT